MSVAPDRTNRITSIAEELRRLELEDGEILSLLGQSGLAESRILAALDGLAAQGATMLADLNSISTRLNAGVQSILDAILGPPAPPAVSATLTVVNNQGEPEPMPSTITVDTVGEKLELDFLDDHGDTDAAPPLAADGSAAVITYGTSDESVITVDPTGALTVVGEGSADLSVAIDDASGNPILEADGVTPFAPAPVTVTVTAGAAVGARIEVTP